MMNHKLAIGVACAALALAACHSNRRQPWQDAKVAAPLQIPSTLDKPATSAMLDVPASARSVEGAVHAISPLPPTSIKIDVDQSVEAEWKKVVTALDAANAGTVLSRDADAHRYAINFNVAQLNLPEQGVFHRMFHGKPDASRTYFAAVSVIELNGQVSVHIDGDGLAVARVHELLDGKLK